ncbi:hypothetical protein HYFRA_00004808 [Hymenoscyphus fraxineus]|uniref:CHL4-domain-containing protein n=1 Tax=Hymenoscyphus fraxineus TaxID=746836 RepID=A0A9N9KNE7_9HELO|nr:hypothetical protein HYFRA_00004808 [Hymenoscyphus fraxineus]
MSLLSIPTTSALPSTQRISSNPAVIKTLGRLSRPSLLSLALDWLDERNQENTAPYLVEGGEDEDGQDLYPPATSLEALREIYTDLQSTKGSKRDVVDRIVEGDWRDGITLYQLAMADMQYLYDHPSSQKWTALKVVRIEHDTPKSDSKLYSIPRFHPATFLRNLQNEILPDVKAHYNLDRHKSLPLLILRVFIVESPYNTSLALSQKQTFDSSKTFYIAFPDDSPFVYVSLTTSSQPPGQSASRADNKSLRRLTLEGIPKAFSRPRERYKLESTSLSARSLATLIDRRGGGRTNAAGGGWSVYASENKDASGNPLGLQLPTPDPSCSSDKEEDSEKEQPRGLKRAIKEDSRIVKRRKSLAKVRFGTTAQKHDEKGIEKLTIRILDPFPTHNLDNHELIAEESDHDPGPLKRRGRKSGTELELENQEEEDDEAPADEFRPQIDFEFQGDHVFAGIRELVELGVIDGERMPGWMTGEEGVSMGRVRNGRITGFKGSGL